MIVIDASVVAELLLQGAHASKVWAVLTGRRGVVAAPAILDLEVASVLRRKSFRDEITDVEASEALKFYQLMRIEKFTTSGVLDRVWALRSNFTPYDASYIALAELFGATLVTRDEALISTLHKARVELI